MDFAGNMRSVFIFRRFFTKSRFAVLCNCADLLLTKLHKYYNILVRCSSKCLHGICKAFTALKTY